MPKPKKNTKSAQPARTQQVPIQEVKEEQVQSIPEIQSKEPVKPAETTNETKLTSEDGFHLNNVDVGKAPNEVHKPKPTPVAPISHKAQEVTFKKISNKIWNTLEWLATSALIFMVLFFALNYQSYSALLFSKLNQLRGQVQTNPYIQNILRTNDNSSQQPLPLTTTPAQSAREIPPLTLDIAPPDDRIIIPRIDKNVPIVKVSDENLVKRDWNALESDIQKALQEGVVHYPGTAEPGDNGNVVITGHSSYFSWDPGRFKDVFALLHEVVIGDTVVVYHNQQKYLYQVYDIKVVTPDKVDVLTQAGSSRLTLITCTPVGTNLKRLVVLAKPI